VEKVLDAYWRILKVELAVNGKISLKRFDNNLPENILPDGGCRAHKLLLLIVLEAPFSAV
jgi:hypothetical protein